MFAKKAQALSAAINRFACKDIFNVYIWAAFLSWPNKHFSMSWELQRNDIHSIIDLNQSQPQRILLIDVNRVAIAESLLWYFFHGRNVESENDP